MRGRERVELKTPAQVRKMRVAGLVVADMLEATAAAAQPGVSTAELNAIAADVLRRAGATSSFLGYHGFPAVICTSVNEQIVHGIPGSQVLQDGDVLSIDAGAIVDGWHGDSAVTVMVGSSDPADVALSAVTESSMWAGIAALATADRLVDVGGAVEDTIVAAETAELRYGIVEEFGGHGIGTAMHQAPHVLNYRTREKGPRIVPGMCLAIEPMVTRGRHHTRTLADEWTVVTTDGSRAAHWEHTVAVLEDGLWVLTARDGGAEQLGARGVRVSPLD